MALGQALAGAGRSLWGMQGARQAAIGAGVGGAYGLFSDDWNVVSGAMGGAALGAATRGLARYGAGIGRHIQKPGTDIAGALTGSVLKHPGMHGAGLGMTAGGLYGMFADNTSMLGGALGGLAIGAGLGAGAGVGMRAMGAGGRQPQGWGGALSHSLSTVQGRATRAARRAHGGFRTMQSSFLNSNTGVGNSPATASSAATAARAPTMASNQAVNPATSGRNQAASWPIGYDSRPPKVRQRAQQRYREQTLKNRWHNDLW